MGDELVIGRVLGSFGVRGELRLAVVDPELLQAGLEIRLHDKKGHVLQATLETVRPHGKGLVARLKGFDERGAVDALRGASIVLAREELPSLTGDAYREADLVGLEVIDKNLGLLGAVREVRHYPSSDMLVVGPDALLVPMLRAYGVHVDKAKRTIRVELPEGFDELT